MRGDYHSSKQRQVFASINESAIHLQRKSMKNILTKQEDGIYEIMLNRPESLNALNSGMRNDLLASLDEIAGSATVRCVLLKAAGPGFMAGGDVKFFHQKVSQSPDERRSLFKQFVEGIHPFVIKMSNLP